MTTRADAREAAEFILSARRYIPLGDAHLTAAESVLKAAGVYSPGEIAKRPPLPPVELVLVGRLAANDRARTVYRIVIDGQEIGTAAQWDDRPSAPWSLTIPGYCANLGHASRAAVQRILTTGQLWES